MRVQSLTDNGSSCYLITFKNTNILIDCPIHLESLLHLHPLPTMTTKIHNNNNKINIHTNQQQQHQHHQQNNINNINGMLQVQQLRFNIPKALRTTTTTTTTSSTKTTTNENENSSSSSSSSDSGGLAMIDLSNIDVILISNIHHMLALPYLFQNERAKSLFHGRIYATEPTVQIGRQHMEELVNCVHRAHHRELQSMINTPNLTVPIAKGSKKRTLENDDASMGDDDDDDEDSFIRQLYHQFMDEWKSIYTVYDIEQCMKFVRPVSFQERISVFGSFVVTPVSSGFCLGSANWIIQTEYEKMVYLSCSSSATARHPEPLAIKELKNADLVLIADVSSQSSVVTQDARTLEMSMNDLCRSIGLTVSSGCDVLIPTYSSGIVYDLIEVIRSYLNSLNLLNVNMFFVSPSAKHSLAYSNISSEWLCSQKQEKAFVAEPPFIHHNLLANKQLQVFPAMNAEFAQVYHQNRSNPCIIFTGHPSCRLGDVLPLIKLLGGNPRSAMLCIEPDFPVNNLTAPFDMHNGSKKNDLHINIIHCPIDVKLKANEVHQLIKTIEPENLLLPLSVAQHLNIKILQGIVPGTIYTIGSMERTLIRSLTRKYEQAKVSDELANEIFPKQMKGMNVARISARVHAKDGAYLLLPDHKVPSASASSATTEEKRPTRQQMLFGDVTVERIIHSLQSEGLDVRVDMESFGLYKISLPALNSIVTFSAEETQIDAPTKKIRDYLRKIVCANFYIL